MEVHPALSEFPFPEAVQLAAQRALDAGCIVVVCKPWLAAELPAEVQVRIPDKLFDQDDVFEQLHDVLGAAGFRFCQPADTIRYPPCDHPGFSDGCDEPMVLEELGHVGEPFPSQGFRGFTRLGGEGDDG
jgi:hypothetical protein